MRVFLIINIVLAFLSQLPAQDTARWDEMDQIILLRYELKRTMRENDKTAAIQKVQELKALNSGKNTAFLWDERWMLYHWTGDYESLFNEVQLHTEMVRNAEAYKVLPPTDSLFEKTDAFVYAHYDQILSNLRATTRSAEDVEFARLHLNYLLRDNSDAEQQRRNDFLKTYPNSRFTTFIQTFMTLPPRPSKIGGGFDILFVSSNWSSDLERSINPGLGVQIGAYLTYNKYVFAGRFQYTGQKIARDIVELDDTWKRGSPSVMRYYGAEFGYELLHRKKIRIFPSIEGGWIDLGQTAEDDAADLPFSYTYQGFNYGATLTADIKLGMKNAEDIGMTKSSYHSVRVRLGYSRLPFGAERDDLNGNMLFFALGYNVFFK